MSYISYTHTWSKFFRKGAWNCVLLECFNVISSYFIIPIFVCMTVNTNVNMLQMLDCNVDNVTLICPIFLLYKAYWCSQCLHTMHYWWFTSSNRSLVISCTFYGSKLTIDSDRCVGVVTIDVITHRWSVITSRSNPVGNSSHAKENDINLQLFPTNQNAPDNFGPPP